MRKDHEQSILNTLQVKFFYKTDKILANGVNENKFLIMNVQAFVPNNFWNFNCTI